VLGRLPHVWGVGQVLFCCAPWSGFEEQSCVGAPFLLGQQMTTEIQRLECLGWRVLYEGRQEDGRWCVLAKSCGHFIISFADARSEAWAALFSMAMKLTEESIASAAGCSCRACPHGA